jgi:hypothetical protein
MAKRFPNTRGPAVSTKIPILTLSGGVSRQPQSKRLPSEAQNMDNALVTLERSFEKRPGFEIINQSGFTGNISDWNSIPNAQRLDLFGLSHSSATTKDYWFYWFNLNDENRFLVVVDYKATGANDVILRIFKLNTDGTWSDQTEYTNSPTNTQQGTSIISANTRAYITYGNATNNAKDVLKATTIGSSIVILNTLVKAGFTSGPNGFLYNLDGTESASPDTKGPQITYYSSARYTKGSDSKWYLNTLSGDSRTITFTSTFIVGRAVTLNTAPTLPTPLTHTVSSTNFNPSPQNKFYIIKNSTNWAVLDNWKSGGTSYTVDYVFPGSTFTTGDSVTVYSGYMPEVEDFIWHETSEPWFGQSMIDFSEIRFPPEQAEVVGNNGLVFGGTILNQSAKNALDAIYGTSSGNGKIYFTSSPYLNFTSGYYRIVNSSSKPYTQKVRSPDLYSVIDERRMPQKITFNASAPTYKWTANSISWQPRTSGDRYSNSGPSIFLNDTKTAPRQVAIKALSTFRDRLYFAAEDVVFTSQLGVYEDLFLNDPSNIVSTDPIDIRASSNSFTEISSLTPFNAYLFINTLGSVQYELKGSQNQITPLTAEISPTAFYSTAKFTEPQLLGSLIYFFDKSKLYLYLSSESSDLAIAQELTVTCPNYLPTTYRSICTAPAQNYIACADNTNQNYLYFHASRFAGDRNLQNAFFRYVLNSSEKIMSIQSFDDYLYSVVKIPTTSATTSGGTPTNIGDTPAGAASVTDRYYLMRTYMREESPSIPRLDRLINIKLYDNNSDYDFSSNETKIRIPISFPYQNVESYQLITDSTWSSDPSGSPAISSDRVYEIASPKAYTIKDGYLEMVFDGRFVPTTQSSPTSTITIDYGVNKRIYLGIKFNMEVELSEQFIRDQNNNVIDGVLNLRTITTRHKNTGNYDIEISNRGRTPVISSYTNQQPNNNQDPLNLENWVSEGEFVSNILGFSDHVNIKITSDYPTPVNIVNMELKGKFIQKYSSLSK